MKNPLLLLALLVSCFQLTAQEIDAKVDERSKYLVYSSKWTNKEKQGFQLGDQIIQVEKTGTKLQTGYTVKFDGCKHGIIVRSFDGQGNKLNEVELENGERKFGPVGSEAIVFNGRLLLLYYKYENTDSMKLYVSEIDRQSQQLVNTKFLFGYAQENVGVFKLANAMNHSMRLRISADSSKLLVAAISDNEQLFSTVLDQDLKTIRSGLSKPGKITKLDLGDAYVDNSGNFGIFLKDPAVLSTDQRANIKMLLMQNSEGKEKTVDMDTWVETMHLSKSFLSISKNQSKVFMYGDYSGTAGNDGVWMAEIQPAELRVSRPKTTPYPDALKQQLYDIGFGEKKKGNYGVVSVSYDLIEFENGDIAIGGTTLKMRDAMVMDGEGKQHGRITNLAGPIVVAIFKGTAKPNFAMIPRYQWLCSGSYPVLVPYKDKLVVLYNDTKDNITRTDDPNNLRMRGLNAFRELSLATAVLTKDGKLESRKLLVDGFARLNFFSTLNCETVNPGEFVVPSEAAENGKNAQKLAIVSIR